MATQNVKILVRRGLREQLTSDILDTGEFGFTTDTNQLFIGIDEAINEIQFDPFINAHAIIQSWLDNDCPIGGLTVDEDLVIRNIPSIFDLEGERVSGVEIILSKMHFYTQSVTLVGNINADINDVLYQRRFIFADDETLPSDIEANKTYQIRELRPNSNDFLNNAAGIIGKSFSNYDNFTVRSDYTGDDSVPNPHNVPEDLRLVEIVNVKNYTSGVVTDVINDTDNGTTKIKVRLRSGYPHYIMDSPYATNYYHFNGDEQGNLKSDFGLFRYQGHEKSVDHNTIELRVRTSDGQWETRNVLDPNSEVNHPINDIIYPSVSFGADGEFAKTEYQNSIRFFQKVGGIWNLLSGATLNTGELIVSFEEPQNANVGDIWVSYNEILSPSQPWIKQDVTIIDEANYPDDIVATEYNGLEIYAPSQLLFDDENIEDYAVVTKSSKITYWERDTDDSVWKLLGSEKYETGNVELVINNDVHNIPTNVLDRYNKPTSGYWKVIITENVNDNPTITELVRNTDYDLWLDDTTLAEGEIRIHGIDSDEPEDTVEIRYYYYNDFQFSTKPPMEYTNQNGTYFPPLTSSNGDDPVVGDYYVYTDKDIFGGTKLNMFHWDGELNNYIHDNIPVYYSDEEASENATNNILIYALPNVDLNVGIIELRMRDYETSTMWYPFEYSRILSYFFTINPLRDVSDTDLTYARFVEGVDEFSVGNMGRERRNVEVVTENTFNRLFADQHLSAHDAETGLRSSLFKKVLDLSNEVTVDGLTEVPIFLKFNKKLNSVFFIDYSLKQMTPTKTFLRVGQLKVINGYPNGIPEIKLTDENTEIWHDNLLTGDDDTIEDHDEFSNITFDTAVREDENGTPLNDMYITYKQDEDCITEISYTIKRWTM
jgi:hypothetical protein